MNLHLLKWLAVAAVLALVGIAGLLGHVVLASELGIVSYFVLAAAAILIGWGIGHAAAEVNRRHQVAIERHNQELAALNAVAVTASRSLELASVLTDCLDKTLEVMQVDAGAILLSGDSGPTLGAQRGLSEEFLTGLTQQVKLDDSADGCVVLPDGCVLRKGCHGSGAHMRASVSVPLRSEGRVVGAMYLLSHGFRAFTQREVQILVSIADVIGMAVQNARLHAQVKESATRDALTGLYNRRSFDQLYVQEVARSSRYATPLTVAMIDINDFKGINDRLGHPAGDQALEAVGKILRGGRSTDIAARYGGDEFVVMMPNTDRRAARAVIERIREAARATRLPGILDAGIELSIGLADSTEGYDRILERADARMYREKRETHADCNA